MSWYCWKIITNIQKERVYKYNAGENEINLTVLVCCRAVTHPPPFYCEGQAYELPVQRLLFVADLTQPAGRAGCR